jgi:hypothetical protein
MVGKIKVWVGRRKVRVGRDGAKVGRGRVKRRERGIGWVAIGGVGWPWVERNRGERVEKGWPKLGGRKISKADHVDLFLSFLRIL